MTVMMYILVNNSTRTTFLYHSLSNEYYYFAFQISLQALRSAIFLRNYVHERFDVYAVCEKITLYYLISFIIGYI